MKSKFNLSSEHKKSSLHFQCVSCNACFPQKQNIKSCSCGSSLFKVSRSIPLINYPLDPYRKKDTDEDGLYLTNFGDNSTSVGGNELYDFPKDGGEGEEFGIPGAKSDDILQTEVMRDVNLPDRDRPNGITMMNTGFPSRHSDPSVFDQLKKKLNYNYQNIDR